MAWKAGANKASGCFDRQENESKMVTKHDYQRNYTENFL